MKIYDVHIENFAGIENEVVEANGKSLFITGENATGKTTILRAIAAAFNGITDEDVRNGTGDTRVVVITDTLIVERTYDVPTQKKSLRVFLRETGARVQSPAEVLKSISRKLFFDPLRFVAMKQGEQRNALLALAGTKLPLKDVVGRLLRASLDNQRTAESAADLSEFATNNADVWNAGDDAVGVCERLAEVAYQRRRELNAEGEKLRYLIAASGVFDAEVNDETLAGVIRAKRATWRQQLDAIDSQAAALDRAYKFFHDELLDEITEGLDGVIPFLRYTRREGLLYGEDTPVKSLSSSEQLNLALRIAEEQPTEGGLRTLLIDGAERLDRVHWQKLQNWIEDVGVQAFVTMVTVGPRTVNRVEPPKRELRLVEEGATA